MNQHSTKNIKNKSIINNESTQIDINTSILLTSILMLQNSPLRNNLYELTKNITKMNMLSYIINKTKLEIDAMNKLKQIINEDMIFILENIDLWIIQYNSTRRMNMPTELVHNLSKIKKMFNNYLNKNN